MKTLSKILIISILFMMSCEESGEEPLPPLEASDFKVEIDRYSPSTGLTFNYNVTDLSTSSASPAQPASGARVKGSKGTKSDYSFEWDFGDGNTSDVCCGVHSFSEGGEFTVTITITRPDGEVLKLSETVEVGPGEYDNVFGYNPRGKFYRRALRSPQGVEICVADEYNPCAPEKCCASDDIWVFYPDLTYDHYQNKYNDCVCLDVNFDPTQDTEGGNSVGNYWYPFRDGRTLTKSENSFFRITRAGNQWTENFNVMFPCDTSEPDALADLQIAKSDDSCGCGNFNLLSNTGSNYIVANVIKSVDGETIQDLLLYVDPGMSLNLDCDKVCSDQPKDVILEITCAKYYTPVF